MEWVLVCEAVATANRNGGEFVTGDVRVVVTYADSVTTYEATLGAANGLADTESGALKALTISLGASSIVTAGRAGILPYCTCHDAVDLSDLNPCPVHDDCDESDLPSYRCGF